MFECSHEMETIMKTNFTFFPVLPQVLESVTGDWPLLTPEENLSEYENPESELELGEGEEHRLPKNEKMLRNTRPIPLLC